MIRIAVGKKVHHSDCVVAFHGPSSLEISYRRSRDETVVHMILLEKDLLEVKYFKDGRRADGDALSSPIHDGAISDDDIDKIECFLAMRIDKTDHNGLSSIVNTYSSKENDYAKGYVVVEFRSVHEFQQLFDVLAANSVAGAFFNESSELNYDNIERYCNALISDNEKDVKQRRESMRSSPVSSRSNDKFLDGKEETAILLVYPFPGDKVDVELDIEKCSEGLKEAAVSYPTYLDGGGSIVHSQQLRQKIESDLLVSNPKLKYDPSETKANTTRAHYLEIRVNDFTRLEPREFLNDTLIDFWFQW